MRRSNIFYRLLLSTIIVLAMGSSCLAQYDQLFAEKAPTQSETISPLFAAPALSNNEVTPYPATPYDSAIVPIESLPAESLIAEPVPTPALETIPAKTSGESSTASGVADELFETTSVDTLDAIVADETPEVAHWYYPAYWFGPTPWDSGFELGMNGSSGTSESLSLRTGGFIKRKGKDYKIDLSLYYNKTSNEGEDVQSNALLDARYDWLFEDSRWSLFLMSQTFYDEFQAFDLNVNVNAGVGYQWIDREKTKFSTTFGSGASREFGGVDESWVPEASFGFNFEQYLSKTKKFYAKMDYFPEWADFDRYRILTDIGLEIELSQPSNLSLKLAATDRYDSEPDGVDPHNLNYSALLILKL